MPLKLCSSAVTCCSAEACILGSAVSMGKGSMSRLMRLQEKGSCITTLHSTEALIVPDAPA